MHQALENYINWWEILRALWFGQMVQEGEIGWVGWGVVGVKEGGYLGPALATLSRVPPLNTIEDPPNQG